MKVNRKIVSISNETTDQSEFVEADSATLFEMVWEITRDDFKSEGIIFQIGIAPRRIDITTVIDGVRFIDAYPKRKIIKIGDIEVPVISQEDLIINKEATGRDKDLLDVKMLRKQNSNK